MTGLNLNFKIENLLDLIQLNKGDKILLSSDILKILVKFKKNKQNIDPNIIINFFIKKIGNEGTLLVPTYNWDFCRGVEFDYNKTKSSSGSLGNICLGRNDFKRSKNPIYSFAVFGKDQKKICELDHKSCFGLDSPFGYLIQNEGKNIFLNINYKDAFTFSHVAEEVVGVEYRYFKKFKGIYCNEHQEKKLETYEMYVRKQDLVKCTKIDHSFDDILKENKSYEEKILNKFSISTVDINTAHSIMINDIKKSRKFIYPEMI